MHDERFTRGVEFFNTGYFFECHDILEDLWMDTTGRDKLFLQGLIQVSVGYYHFFNDNFKGAASQLTKGLTKLNRFRPAHFGIELERFMKHVDVWLNMAERKLGGEHDTVDDSRVPKIEFNNKLL